MPIYRLKSSGEWRKLSKIYRLKNTGAWRSLSRIYRLKSNGEWKKVFSSTEAAVTQTSSPTSPSGSGEAFTSVGVGSSGTYTNINTSYGIVKKLVKMSIDLNPINGSETKYGTDLTNSYTVTQEDATTPVYKYYTEDSVKNQSGTKTYYFYSSMYVQAYVGNITDNFNRTVSVGLGTSSSSYIYSSYANLTSGWSVNGSRAVNSASVTSGASASNHPLQTIEVGSSNSSKVNKTYSIDIPDGKGGQGVAFWVTSANSWYAVTSYFDYDSSTVNVVTCTATGSYSNSTGTSTTPCNDANPTGTTSGTRCGACTYVNQTAVCTGTGTYSNNSGSSTSACESANPTDSIPIVGNRCGSCTYTGSSTSVSCSGTGTYSNTSGSSTSACESANPSGTTDGTRCGSCTYTGSSTSIQCTGTGSYSNTSGTATGPCETANPIGSNIGDRCGSCTYVSQSSSTTYPCTGSVSNQSTCPSEGSGNGDRCSVCTPSTTYPCSGGTVSSATCPDTGPLAGDRCSACTTVDTFGLCRSTSLTPVCPSCPNGTTSNAQYNCSTGFWQCRCRTFTYTVRTTATVYSYSVRQTLVTTTYNFTYPSRASVTTYSFTYPKNVSVTTYNFTYPKYVAQYNFTYPKNEDTTATQYTYNTKMKVWSAISGVVSSNNWDNSGNATGLIINNTRPAGESFDTSNFTGIYKIVSETSGNIVTAKAYDSGGSQIGSTLTKTFSSPTKSSANDETSSGIIKAHTPNNVGTLYDNLSIV